MGCFSGSTASAVVTTEPDIANANPQMIAKALLSERLSVMGCLAAFPLGNIDNIDLRRTL
jgi:hypothetical protein